jgi:hypothetical protein
MEILSRIRWQLELGGKVIAKIADAKEYEFPWTYGIIVDSPEFERFRRFFTDPDDWADNDPELEALTAEVHSKGEFLLRNLQTGKLHHPFRMNQNREYVWFRIGWPESQATQS